MGHINVKMKMRLIDGACCLTEKIGSTVTHKRILVFGCSWILISSLRSVSIR